MQPHLLTKYSVNSLHISLYPCLSHWSGQQQHLLQWLQALGAQEMQWAQALEKGH